MATVLVRMADGTIDEVDVYDDLPRPVPEAIEAHLDTRGVDKADTTFVDVLVDGVWQPYRVTAEPVPVWSAHVCAASGAIVPCEGNFCCGICGRHAETGANGYCYCDGSERYAPPSPEWRGKESGSGVFAAIGWAFLLSAVFIGASIGLIVRFLKHN